MNDLRGHNSAAFGQELRADLETLLNEDSDKLFIYAQWHINDYIAGTAGMSLEHEGAYQRFLMRLYSRGKPLPDDDTFMAPLMALSTRVWRRVKQILISMGKIIIRAGCLTNPRFEKERIKRAEQLRKRSLAAQTRWQYERENKVEKEVVPHAEVRVSPKFAGSLAETSPKLSENLAHKPNEIKGNGDASAYANQEPITNIKEDLPIDAHVRVRKDPPNWEMLAAYDPDEKRTQKELWRIEDGSLAISDKLRRELGREFPKVPIDETLTIIRTESKIQDGAKALLNSIYRKFAYAQRDEIARERRYAERLAALEEKANAQSRATPAGKEAYSNSISAAIKDVVAKVRREQS